jgi:hypothetical protein
MQTRMIVLISTALTVWAPVCAGPAAAGGIRLAQLVAKPRSERSAVLA